MMWNHFIDKPTVHAHPPTTIFLDINNASTAYGLKGINLIRPFNCNSSTCLLNSSCSFSIMW